MKRFFIFIFVILSLQACTKKNIYSEFQSFKDAKWDKDSVCHFKVDIKDTLSFHNIYVGIRNNNQYSYQNIWLFIDLKTPQGSVRHDTLKCDLADSFGKWYGKGIGLYQLDIAYEDSIIFPRKGIYTFSIKQGMRDNLLNGISEIGIKIK